LWQQLFPFSLSIALVAYVESYSVGATLANRARTRVNHHQELIALGAANIGAAFTGAYPVAGSFSRSSVNYQAGGRTTISSLVCMVVIVITLLFFTPLFERLPHAALAAIIIISVIGLMDFGSLKRQWEFYRRDAITQGITFVTVIVFGVTTGLLTGVIFSIAFFIHRSSKPKVTVVGRVDGGGHFRSTRRHSVETKSHIAAVRVDENLYFANASQVENKLIKTVQRRPDTKHLILVCSSINLVDISGLEMLYRLNQNLQAAGVDLHMSDVKGPVMNQLDACDFVSQLTGSVFFSADQAMTDLSQQE
jgi:SulP family sulfate permease